MTDETYMYPSELISSTVFFFFLYGFDLTHEQVLLQYIFSMKSVQQQDAGKYWCVVEHHGAVISSEPAWITVEGKSIPLFTLQLSDTEKL